MTQYTPNKPTSISSLITMLQKALHEFGDVPVLMIDDECLFNDDLQISAGTITMNRDNHNFKYEMVQIDKPYDALILSCLS